MAVVAAGLPLQGQYVQQGQKIVSADSSLSALQGSSVALSADGNVLIVGALYDFAETGSARIYLRVNGVWIQDGPPLVGANSVGRSWQGTAVAISADGNTALVGGSGDNPSGAVWVYARANGAWRQQGPKLAPPAAVMIGDSVALSADGNTAVSGDPLDGEGTGGVWVFTRANGFWTQQGNKLVGAGAVSHALQGRSVAISGDGNTLVIGGPGDNAGKGAIWVFVRNNNVWTQQGAKLVGTSGISQDCQGTDLAISMDGSTVVTGGCGVPGSPGRAWVFTRTNGAWTQQGNPMVGPGALNASSELHVALAGDGNTVVLSDTPTGPPAPAAWMFGRDRGLWGDRGRFTPSGIDGDLPQVVPSAISADASTFVIGGVTDHHNMGASWVFVRPTPTTVSLLASVPAPVYGQPIRFAADVRTLNQTVAGIAAGSVQFFDNNLLLPAGDVALAANGIASVITPLNPGTHTVMAVFSPISTVQSGNWASIQIDVARAATTTALVGSFAPSVVLTAQVSTAARIGDLSGTVQFLDTSDRSVVGQAAVSRANATAAISLPPVQSAALAGHAIQAIYSGDSNFSGSASTVIAIPVLKNAASGASVAFAPGEFVSLFGLGLTATTANATPPLPVSLAGVSVMMTDSRGVARSAMLSYVSSTQINFVVPDLAPGPASMSVLNGTAVGPSLGITIAAVAPGLFSADSSGTGQAAAQIVRVTADGSQSIENAASGITFGADRLYLILYGTGLRNRSSLGGVACRIQTQNLPVSYADAHPDFPGLDQVNVELPSSLAASGTVDVAIIVDGIASNSVTLTFR